MAKSCSQIWTKTVNTGDGSWREVQVLRPGGHHKQSLWLNGKVVSGQGDRTPEWKACKQWVTLLASKGGWKEEGRMGRQPKLVQVCVCVLEKGRESLQSLLTIKPLLGSPGRLSSDIHICLRSYTNAYNYRKNHAKKQIMSHEVPHNSHKCFRHSSYANDKTQAHMYTHTHRNPINN